MSHRGVTTTIAGLMLAPWLVGGCSSDSPAPPPSAPATHVLSDLDGEAFYAAPFPSDHRLARPVTNGMLAGLGKPAMLTAPSRSEAPVRVSPAVTPRDGHADGAVDRRSVHGV